MMRKIITVLVAFVLIDLNAMAQTAYVGNTSNNTISVINLVTNAVIATIPVGQTPYGVSVSHDGTKAYITNGLGNTVSIINTATNTVSTIVVGNNPFGISVSPDGTKVCVADYSATGSISVINPVTNTVSTTIAVGSFPYSFGNFITASQIQIGRASCRERV